MNVEIKVEYSPNNEDAYRLRSCLCEQSCRMPEENYNPLHQTSFNAILDSLVQKAFDDGRAFEREHPELGT